MEDHDLERDLERDLETDLEQERDLLDRGELLGVTERLPLRDIVLLGRRDPAIPAWKKYLDFLL